MTPNQVTRANAGGACRFQIRALRTARIAQFHRLPMRIEEEMHGQTLRMSRALGRNVQAVFRRPLHARAAEQRFARRRNARTRERERRPPANQADRAARTSVPRAFERPGCPAAHPQRSAAIALDALPCRCRLSPGYNEQLQFNVCRPLSVLADPV